ncbi:MAG: DUF2284 domain-containing protein [Thermoplasmata archaeon]|jgi:predicted metal-binding protein|nr:DUF2284 domain-containing protein [Thermoplasmata archaeon]
MARTERSEGLEKLVRFARSQGASGAKAIPARLVVVDGRVRLKCQVPRCVEYGRNLMCPPNTMPVDEFREVLGLYKRAVLVQVETDVDSLDKSERQLGDGLSERIDSETGARAWQLKLHRLVNAVETEAFKQGHYLAAGLTGGDCRLCEECVGVSSGKPCRHPFEARPSMEAMGIDVLRTCRNAGMPVSLSSSRKVRWTGLVLVD